MKIKGKQIKDPYKILVVFPRQDEPIVFYIQAIMDYDEFNALCKMPIPPEIIKRGEGKVVNTKDASYKNALNIYTSSKTDYMVIKGILTGTPEFEFEQVDINKPETWSLWKKEFRDSGFSEGELVTIFYKMLEVNSLDNEKLDEARNRFLATLEQQ